MRKTVIILLIVVFILSIFSFLQLGGVLRDALSPKVAIAEISDEKYEGKYYSKLPSEAVKTDGTETFVYSISLTDKYPEKSYIAVRCPINIVKSTDNYVYIQIGSLMNYRYVIIHSDQQLSNGDRVKVIAEDTY